ncbi:hypothetical protein VTN96DRAFT_5524 [Rasamsonia emersonii]
MDEDAGTELGRYHAVSLVRPRRQRLWTAGTLCRTLQAGPRQTRCRVEGRGPAPPCNSSGRGAWCLNLAVFSVLVQKHGAEERGRVLARSQRSPSQALGGHGTVGPAGTLEPSAASIAALLESLLASLQTIQLAVSQGRSTPPKRKPRRPSSGTLVRAALMAGKEALEPSAAGYLRCFSPSIRLR